MDSNNQITHQSYWKQEMKTIDLKQSDSLIKCLELRSFIQQKFENEVVWSKDYKPYDAKINYKNIFKNGVSEEAIENAFVLARFKLKWDIEKGIEMYNHLDSIVFEKPIAYTSYTKTFDNKHSKI